MPMIGYMDTGIGDQVIDTGPNELHGYGINRPVRAMTGYNWNGRDDCFRLAPEQYGGIHFHDDALVDCQWEPTLTHTIPESLMSGCYALRVRAEDTEDHIPFIVRAAKPQAKIAMLMPTATYLGYANEHLAFDFHVAQSITAHTPVLTKYDVELYRKEDYGLSTYDYHSDGVGVCYSSYRRPIYNLRPKHRTAPVAIPWGFPADLSIIGWLEHKGYNYEVITDEDLHRDGLSALKPYNVVINGAHPEYYSERMLDATESYLNNGGRLMYVGGNGYYWVASFRDDELWCMEVRKLESGSRAWQARPGEHYHANSGERGGLWKNRGRPPQKLTGVGFTSEGMDKSMPYLRMPDSYHKTVSWIFDGIGVDEPIGDFGLALGGAAGIETDRYELMLGTPPHTKILASSEMFSDYWMHVQEEILYNYPGLRGSEDYQIRADMTYFTTRNNGAVFCSGSIAWGHALPIKNFDNNVSTIMANVVNAFAKDGKLPGSKYIAEEKHWK
jgi:N,N-dimethylformamidase